METIQNVTLGTNGSVGDDKIRKDLRWGQYLEFRNHARHSETLRLTVVNYSMVERIFKRDFSAPLPVAARRREQEERQHGRLVAARGVALKEKIMKIASLFLIVLFALVSSDVVFADDCNQVGKFKVKFTSVEHGGLHFIDQINNFRGFLCSDGTTEVDGKVSFFQAGPVTSDFPVPLEMPLEFTPGPGSWTTDGVKIFTATTLVPTGVFEEFLLDNYGSVALVGWTFTLNIPILEHADLDINQDGVVDVTVDVELDE